jgi:hypothetical protein
MQILRNLFLKAKFILTELKKKIPFLHEGKIIQQKAIKKNWKTRIRRSTKSSQKKLNFFVSRKIKKSSITP